MFVDHGTVMYLPLWFFLCLLGSDGLWNYVQIVIDIYYGLFEIFLELCFIYILLIYYLRFFLRVLVVSSLHSITLAMWFGVTPRGSSLARWLGSCLPMTILSDRNMSLGNVLWTKENKVVFVCVLLLLLTLRILLNAIVHCFEFVTLSWVTT